MKPSRNIGNSFLPSSSPEILRKIPFRDGYLQVVPVYSEDTHHLIYNKGNKEYFLAKHKNGYSCHSLAKRMVEGDWKRIEEQAQYIVDCGGYSDISLIATNRLV